MPPIGTALIATEVLILFAPSSSIEVSLTPIGSPTAGADPQIRLFTDLRD